MSSSKLEILVAAASHDVRNALAVISTATSLVTRRGRLDPADSPAMARVARAAARVEQLIEVMTTFSSLEQGVPPELQRAPTDLAALVEEVAAELRAETSRAITVSSEGSARALVDPMWMRRVFGTIIGNALDYSPLAAKVRVSLRRGERGLTIAISNEGPPIPTALLDRIFQPFAHGRERTASRRSLGLGLYIAHAIVRAHGGTLTATSSEDEGTTFTIALPAEVLSRP